MPRWTPEHLSPSAFAFVMASGIVTIGASLRGFSQLAWAIQGITATGYVVLVLLTGWRLARYRAAMVDDLRHPGRGFGYFTFVAGSNSLAVCATSAGWYPVAIALFLAGAAAWFVLGYLVPALLVLSQRTRTNPLIASASGSWFVWVVASQSVAVVAASLEPVLDARFSPALATLAVLTWSIGLVLYAAAAVFVSLRLMMYSVTPNELDPTYWVAMGSVAITVVAGARMLEMSSTPMVDAIRGLVSGLAVILWSFASWLIPVLVATGAWRHWHQGVPLRYDVSLWAMVFPLGMYAVAGMYLGTVDALPFVSTVGSSFYWVALAAWVLTLASMLVHAWRWSHGQVAAALSE